VRNPELEGSETRGLVSHEFEARGSQGRVFPHWQYAIPPLSAVTRFYAARKFGYAAIGERLGGNTRQGNGPSSAYCRVLPGIAGYCRVVGPGEIRNAKCGGDGWVKVAGRTASCRLVPLGTAWDRIKIFAGGACTQCWNGSPSGRASNPEFGVRYGKARAAPTIVGGYLVRGQTIVGGIRRELKRD
jgi:hypothetical protein